MRYWVFLGLLVFLTGCAAECSPYEKVHKYDGPMYITNHSILAVLDYFDEEGYSLAYEMFSVRDTKRHFIVEFNSDNGLYPAVVNNSFVILNGQNETDKAILLEIWKNSNDSTYFPEMQSEFYVRKSTNEIFVPHECEQ